MSLINVFSPLQHRTGFSFPVNLAIGAMLSSLLIVAYAAFASPVSSERAQIVLQGIQIILLTLSAGIIAAAVHRLGVAREDAREISLAGAQRAAS